MVQQLTITLGPYEMWQLKGFLDELEMGVGGERAKQLARFIEAILFGGGQIR